MTLALIVDANTVSVQPLRYQYKDWRFYQISISSNRCSLRQLVWR